MSTGGIVMKRILSARGLQKARMAHWEVLIAEYLDLGRTAAISI
jgi:hypothetical protein